VTQRIEIDGFRIYVLHILAELNPQAADNVDAVIYGHSHQPKTTNGTLFFNPGSAGPRRFRLPITVGRMTVEPKSLSSALRNDSCGDAWDGCYRSATVTFVLTEFAMKQLSRRPRARGLRRSRRRFPGRSRHPGCGGSIGHTGCRAACSASRRSSS
jgi:hypothetical protein